MQIGIRSAGRSQVTLVLGLATAFVIAVLAGAPASAVPPAAKKPPPPLTAQWWQSFVSISGDALSRCDIGSGDVVFLAGTTGGSATRSCTISSRQSILVPLVNGECSTIEGDGQTPAELNKCARDQVDSVTGLHLVIDGVPVSNLSKFRVGSPVYSFTATTGNVFGISAGTSRSVADGYWALINPLSVGTHTLSFGGQVGAFSTTATYTLIVQ